MDLVYYFWLTLENNPHFVHLCEGPAPTFVTVDGVVIRSPIAAWAIDREGTEYAFVVDYARKAKALLGTRTREKRLIAAQAWADLRGARLATVPDRLLLAKPIFIANLARILTHLRSPSNNAERALMAALCHAVDVHKRITLGKLVLLATNSDPSLVHRAALRALYLGAIEADLTSVAISAHTTFFSHGYGPD